MQEIAEQKTDTKPKKSLKHDFSFSNWGETTERWLKGVKKRYTTLFPEVSKQARILAGIKVKPNSESSSRYDSDSSGRDLDSNYGGLGEAQGSNGSNGDGDGWNGDHDGNNFDGMDDGNQQGGQQSDNEVSDGGGQQEGEGNYSQSEEAGEDSGTKEPVAGDDDYEMSEPIELEPELN